MFNDINMPSNGVFLYVGCTGMFCGETDVIVYGSYGKSRAGTWVDKSMLFIFNI